MDWLVAEQCCGERTHTAVRVVAGGAHEGQCHRQRRRTWAVLCHCNAALMTRKGDTPSVNPRQVLHNLPPGTSHKTSGTALQLPETQPFICVRAMAVSPACRGNGCSSGSGTL